MQGQCECKPSFISPPLHLSLFFHCRHSLCDGPSRGTILGSLIKRKSHSQGKDSSLEPAKYWFEETIDCNFAGKISKEDTSHFNSLKSIKGRSQYYRSETPFTLWDKKYEACVVSGPVPYPPMLRLLKKSHDNSNIDRSLKLTETSTKWLRCFARIVEEWLSRML